MFLLRTPAWERNRGLAKATILFYNPDLKVGAIKSIFIFWHGQPLKYSLVPKLQLGDAFKDLLYLI